MVEAPSIGAEITLSHAKRKLGTGQKLQLSERIGATLAYATVTREAYGPTPKTAEPIEIPLPEVVKGAIASAKG